MIDLSVEHINGISAPVRRTYAKVELYNGSTLVNTFRYDGALKSFTIERVGDESKFFGYSVCAKANIKLIDVNRELNITTDNHFIIKLGCVDDLNYIAPYPMFYVTEVHRDEKTNELSITAYDAIYKLTTHTFSELELTFPYTVKDVIAACAKIISTNTINYENVSSTADCFTISYDSNANFSGNETLRETLDAVAEATQTIYFLQSGNVLCFKRLGKDEREDLDIDKSMYFSLTNKESRRLSTIAHATELGDNLSATTGQTGTTQYIRNNPFWDLREDTATLLDNALAAVGGLTIAQFECDWRGDYRLEPGDKLSFVGKDGSALVSYLINDVLTYNGSLREKTQFSYISNDGESFSNPTSLGEIIKLTYAKVDKLNQEISLVASDVTANTKKISSIEINTGSINASVEQMQKNVEQTIDGVNKTIDTLTERVEAAVTKDDLTIEIKKELESGVDKIVTKTGFVFDEEGLTVSKDGSEMTTQITEDGMVVYRNDTAVLTANNEGVNAANLHATTFLIIGNNSRFEDYVENGEQRTGCFWIGGN